MLLLDARTQDIDGISVFPDHADPEQWYYMPTSPHLTTVRDPTTGAEVPQFLLVSFRGDAGEGGLLSFDCDVGASQERIDRIAQKIAGSEGLARPPRVAPVPLVGGSVKLMALGKESGDAPDEGQGDGLDLVLRIDHHAQPALYGINQASFSVRLDKGGFTTVEQCLDGAILPIAVVYSLDFWGLRPAYSIRLSIEWDRVQTHLDENFSAGLWFVSADINKAVDKLVDDRAIVLESDTFVPEGADTRTIIDRRDAALAMVRNMIADNFFTVSIPPWKPQDKEGWEKALDAVGKLATQSALMAAGGPAAGAASSVSFSYKRTDYTRIDQKNLTVNVSERTTIVRSIHPQAHLAGLSRAIRDSGLPRERFVLPVTLDNDWFARRRLKVVYRPGLGVEEIDNINVRARYGNRSQNAVLTAPTFETTFEWLSQLDGGVMRRDVDVSYEVQFRNVDTSERPGSLLFDEGTTPDDEKVLQPEADLFTIKPIPVIAENFPWDRYTSVEVHLRYTDEANSISQTDMLRLTAEAPDGDWKMFVLDRANTGYQVKTVFRAVDNRDFTRDFQPSTEDQVTVRNPFPDQRVVEVTPSAVDWTRVKEAFVDLRYVDPGNRVRVEDSFTFTEGSTTRRFVVDLRDPERTEVFYTVTFILADHSTVVVPESVTRDRRIAIRQDMRGRRTVEVRPPVDFALRRLRTVTVDVRFEDFAAGLSFADSFNFRSPEDRGLFEYDVVDDARTDFEYRYTALLENGQVRTADWTASSDTVLVPRI